MYKFGNDDKKPETTSDNDSGGLKGWERAGLGALIGGGLGALGGAFLTDAPEDMSPSEVFKERLKNALITGALGAFGGAGVGYGTSLIGVGGEAPTMEQRKKDLKEEYGKEELSGKITKGVAGAAVGLPVGALGGRMIARFKGGGRGAGIGALIGGVIGGAYGPNVVNYLEDQYDSWFTKPEEDKK